MNPAGQVASPRIRPSRVAASGSPVRARPLWTVATMADVRAAAYRLFAALFLYPDEQRLGRLSARESELRQHNDALATLAFFGPWQRLLIALPERTEQRAAGLQSEHLRLFNLDPAGVACFPYESCYVASDRDETGWLTARLQQTYAYAGLALAPSRNESPDHAAVELEFMAYLCGQEAAAWMGADRDAAIRALKRQRSFLRHHLGRWFSDFARRVQAGTDELLYVAAAEAADAFIQHDRDLVEVLVDEIDGLTWSAAD